MSPALHVFFSLSPLQPAVAQRDEQAKKSPFEPQRFAAISHCKHGSFQEGSSLPYREKTPGLLTETNKRNTLNKLELRLVIT